MVKQIYRINGNKYITTNGQTDEECLESLYNLLTGNETVQQVSAEEYEDMLIDEEY